MATTHTLRATIPHGDPDIGAEVDVDITYTYRRGSPDTYDKSRGGPGGWDPGYPPEVEFVSAKPMSPYYGAFADMEQQHLDELARNWLDEDGFTEACEHAEERSGPDPDRERDARVDDAMADQLAPDAGEGEYT